MLEVLLEVLLLFRDGKPKKKRTKSREKIK